MKSVTRPVNILLTGVGRRVELVQIFHRAYKTLGFPGRIIGIDMDRLAPGLHECDAQYVGPPSSDPSYVPRLLEICKQEDVALVFPLIDPDVPILAANRTAFEQVKARAVVVGPDAAALTTDKWRTSGLLSRIGVPGVPSWLPEMLDKIDVPYPVVVKPRNGSAGRDVHVVNDAQELWFYLERVDRPIVQQFLEGPEITSDVVCDYEGKVLAVVSRERIAVRGGEVAKGRTVHDVEIIKHGVRIAEALGTVGPINVQCIRHRGKIKFTEINARFGGGFPLSVAAGTNAVEWLLKLAAGKPVSPPPLGTYEVDLHMTRYDQSFFYRKAELDAM